jgi:S1-C subfamily serine protease
LHPFGSVWITVGVLNVSIICAAIFIASLFRQPERRTQTLIIPNPVESVQREVADAAAQRAPAPSETPAAPAKKLTTRDIVQRCEASVAQVYGVAGTGSGFLAGKGILVTNAHVIEHEVVRSLKAYFPSAANDLRGPYDVRILVEDSKQDIAILKINSDLPPLKLAPPCAFKKGEDVTIIGSPGVFDGMVRLQNAITKGILSTEITLEGQRRYQLGASLNRGNSGGPTLNGDGQVIGVVVSKDFGVEAVSFCIPLEELAEVLRQVHPEAADRIATCEREHDMRTIYRELESVGKMYRAALHVYIDFMDTSIRRGWTVDDGVLTAADDPTIKYVTGRKALMEARFVPTLSEITKDRVVAEHVRRDLAELWAICADMSSYIENPRGTYNTYVEKVRELEDKFSHLLNSLRASIGNSA